PPPEPDRRGVALPGPGGLHLRHRARQGGGRERGPAAPAALHLRRRDDPAGPAQRAAAGPLRRHLPARLLLPARAGADRAALSAEPETIEEVYEPFLMQQGYIQRTSRGRLATALAYRHLGLAPPAPGTEQQSLL